MRRSQYLNYSYFLITVLLFTIISCVDDGIIVESPMVILPEAQEIITSDLYGRVLDINDVPIEGAQVTLRSGVDPLLTFTDDQGYFLIRSIPNKGTSAFVTIASVGKLDAFRRFSLQSWFWLGFISEFSISIQSKFLFHRGIIYIPFSRSYWSTIWTSVALLNRILE